MMPNDLLIQPDTEPLTADASAGGCDLDANFGAPIEEKSILVGLYENLLDVFFPRKLPPLELTSTPIPVPDPMAVKRNPWAAGAAFLLNGTILVLLLFFGVRKIIQQPKTVQETPITLSEWKPPAETGGGGGAPDKAPVSKGRIPPRMEIPQAAPKIVQPPTPTVNVQQNIPIPNDPTLPNFGMSDSTNVKLQSAGSGGGIGMGPGQGSGLGSGSGGNFGGQLYRVGGDVSAPIAVYTPEAEFSDEARRNKYQGTCLVTFIVDAHGHVVNPRVVRALGEGLDEKAIEAVLKYRFRPALKDGRTPVAVTMSVEVTFNLY